jgi:hypothetical protein
VVQAQQEDRRVLHFGRAYLIFGGGAIERRALQALLLRNYCLSLTDKY